MTGEIPAEVDVVIIGGGPAGLATAIAARRRGLDVLVADRATPPIDKACGEGLMPDGIAALRRLGVQLPEAAGMPFRGIAFIGDGVLAKAEFTQGCGLGIRRTGLQRLLVDQAEAAGARLCWQAPVDIAGPGRIEINRQAVRCRCRWLIGADGLHSRLAQRLRLQRIGTGPLRIGLRQHYRVRAWTDLVEIHWHQGCQAYVTPVAPEEICVAVITARGGGSRPLRMADLVGRFPGLARRLADAEPAGPLRGAVTQSTRLPAVTRGRSAVVGDASGSVDAITGEGLALAFRQAEALAAALADGNLGGYQAAHRPICRRAHLMARLLLVMDRGDHIRALALRLLASDRWAFQRLLEYHVADQVE